MEFLAGIVFTLFVGFIGHKINQSIKKKKAREAYVPVKTQRPIKDFPDPRKP